MKVLSAQPGGPTASSQAQYDVVVVGAGPYGLSLAAHLKGKGLRVAVFGKPFELWREHMPKGMYLRSRWWMTNLSDPAKRFGAEQFFQHSTYRDTYPVPIQAFIDYGLWFQQQAVPDVDPTYITLIERLEGERYILTLEDGRVITSLAVVMAIGLKYYHRRPAEYAHLSTERLTYSSEHHDFSRFANQTVAVIGGGQSAVEYAALLNENGASVHLIARRSIEWLRPDRYGERSLLEQLRAPDSIIAPGWKYWVLAHAPYLFQRLSPTRKEHHLKNEHHPSASAWLRDRIIDKVHLHGAQVVTHVAEGEQGVELTLMDTTQLSVDHVILATGYQADVRRLPFLSPSIVSAIETHHDWPLLNTWFESSVPGLYFVGFSSLLSFGPQYRFVSGAAVTAPRVAQAVARRVAKIRHT
jgi:FAD-dependent urate hydroxylase